MTDNAELKRLAEAAYPGPWYVENGMDQVRDNADDFVCETGEDEPINSAFIAAANPAAVLALIAENERLTNRLEVDPRHDYDGISTRDATVKVLDEQVDQLKAENERLEVEVKRMTSIAYAAHGAFRMETMAERDQLRAEVAGLRTGYEAYEQVNAELKAENERLERNRDMWKGQVERQSEMLRLAHEADKLLKAECEGLPKHAPSSEIIWCECGDGYPANSYGAGFMAANGGACENCDAAEPELVKITCSLEFFENLRDSAAAEAEEHRQCMGSYRPHRQELLDAVVRQCDELIAGVSKEPSNG